MSQENNLTYILILLIVLVVIFYHFNYKKHLHHNEEPFENNNKSVIIGEVANTLPIGNPILPSNKLNNENSNGEVNLSRVSGNFDVNSENNVEDKNNNNIDNDHSERLNIDNASEGPELLPQGYIIIKFTEVKVIKGFIIKGLKNCRVDINNDGSNVFKPLFNGEIRNNNVDKLNLFSKSSINQTNGVDSDNNIKARSIKITNLDKKNSDEIKLELLEQVSNNLNRNSLINRIDNFKIVNPENKIITKDNNENSNLEIKLEKPEIVSGISLKTDIPHFKIFINKNVSFPKEGMFEGGKNGISHRNYYLDIPVKTNSLKIIPLINPKLFDEQPDKTYTIKDISVFKSRKKSNMNIGKDVNDILDLNNTNIEGFENIEEDPKEVLLKDLQSSIDIQKACAALENQEKINSEELKLQQFKIYNLKLQKQKEEFERLNAVINNLREKRSQQMKKQDMLNVAKYQTLRGQEIQIKDVVKQRLKDQNNFDINLNLIKK